MKAPHYVSGPHRCGICGAKLYGPAEHRHSTDNRLVRQVLGLPPGVRVVTRVDPPPGKVTVHGA